MQAVVSGFSPRFLNEFAHHSYVMRSEPRQTGDPSGSVEPPQGDGPKKKKSRAGYGYKVLTILLLIILWPVGMILLWQRKLRWSAGIKLLVSIVALVACVLLYGFALTVQVDNPKYTAVQDSVNDFLVDAGEKVGEWSGVAAKEFGVVKTGAQDLGLAAWEAGRGYIADGIDKGIDLGAQAREKIEELLKVDLGVEPPVVKAPEVKATADDDISLPDETAEAAAPAATPGTAGEKGRISIMPPKQSAQATNNVVVPLRTPQPTAEPTATPGPKTYGVKPAAEATVYYNDGSGTYYHTVSACGKMKRADEHKFAEVADNKVIPCSWCGAPAKELLDEKYIIWIDENELAHLSDECADFAGKCTLMRADEAIEHEVKGCPLCDAEGYLKDIAEGNMMTVAAPKGSDGVVNVEVKAVTAE